MVLIKNFVDGKSKKKKLEEIIKISSLNSYTLDRSVFIMCIDGEQQIK